MTTQPEARATTELIGFALMSHGLAPRPAQAPRIARTEQERSEGGPLSPAEFARVFLITAMCFGTALGASWAIDTYARSPEVSALHAIA
jgi:hypothetical protein